MEAAQVAWHACKPASRLTAHLLCRSCRRRPLECTVFMPTSGRGSAQRACGSCEQSCPPSTAAWQSAAPALAATRCRCVALLAYLFGGGIGGRNFAGWLLIVLVYANPDRPASHTAPSPPPQQEMVGHFGAPHGQRLKAKLRLSCDDESEAVLPPFSPVLMQQMCSSFASSRACLCAGIFPWWHSSCLYGAAKPS